MKNLAKRAVAGVLHRTGMLKILATRADRHLTILAFHRVVADEADAGGANAPMKITRSQFRRLMVAVRRYANPIGLTQAVGAIENREPFLPGTVVVTFDDGYRDVLDNALPVLEELGVPATVYVATAFAGDRGGWPWWDEVEYRLTACPDLGQDFAAPCAPALRSALNGLTGSGRDRDRRVSRLIRRVVRGLSDNERECFLARLRTRGDGPVTTERIMLTWEDLKRMIAGGLIEVGAHTVSHRILGRLDDSSVKAEIAGSKNAIEKNLDVPCRHFAYPSGVVTEAARRIVRECGMRSATTTAFANNSHRSDRYSLARKDGSYFLVGGQVHAPYFILRLSWLLDALTP